jgi:3-deoxy-D-manno-octulosonic acid kinase
MPSEKWIWGAVPTGFDKATDKQGNRLIVRQDRLGLIDISAITEGYIQNDTRYVGRAPLYAVKLEAGDVALIRAYWHGGLLRSVTRNCFITWPPRPFRELTITEELRRRGIRTVEVYGACVKRVWGPVYQGWLVTRELSGSQDLWSAFSGEFVQRAGMSAILKAMALTLAALHREGVYHNDLNLKNLLVRLEPGGVTAYVIDFDKAKLFLGRLPAALANRNLARLLRSVRKMDPQRRCFTVSAWNEFLSHYYENSAT